MADMTPVGNTGKPLDAFGTLNSILGIQGKRQELQQQAFGLQQTQNFSQFQKDFDPAKYVGNDGTLDDTAVYNSAAFANAGNAKELAQQYIQRVKQGQLANKTSLQTLDYNDLHEMRQGLGAFADDPDVIHDTPAGRAKIEDYYKNFGAGNANRQKIAGTFGQVVTHAPPKDLAAAIRSQQLMAADVATQRANQNPAAGTNAAGQATVRAPMTGVTGLAPIAPGQDESKVNPTTPAVAGAEKRQTGTAGADVELSNRVADWQRTASSNIDNYNRIIELSKDVQQGKLQGKLGTAIGALGSSYNDERAELEQHLGIISANLTERSGSDSRAAEALKQLPKADAPTRVIASSMDFLKGMSRQDLALGRIREKNSARTNGQMNGYQGEYAHATNVASPLMHEFLSLKTKQEQTEFVQRHFTNSKDAGYFLDHLRHVQKTNPDAF